MVICPGEPRHYLLTSPCFHCHANRWRSDHQVKHLSRSQMTHYTCFYCGASRHLSQGYAPAGETPSTTIYRWPTPVDAQPDPVSWMLA